MSASTETKTYYYVRSFEKMTAKILAVKRDCPLVNRSGKDSEQYQRITKWCDVSLIMTQEEYKIRPGIRIMGTDLKDWKGLLTVDAANHIYSTENGCLYDGERDEFVSFDTENIVGRKITDIFPGSEKFLYLSDAMSDAVSDMFFITKTEPFPEFSLEEWQLFVDDLEASKIITRVN